MSITNVPRSSSTRPRLTNIVLFATCVSLLVAATVVVAYVLFVRLTAQYIVADHDVYLAIDASSARALVGLGYDNQEAAVRAVDEDIRTGKLLKMQPGARVRTLEYKILTVNGLVRPMPMSGRESQKFPLTKVKVLDGSQVGIHGWVQATDIQFRIAPLP